MENSKVVFKIPTRVTERHTFTGYRFKPADQGHRSADVFEQPVPARPPRPAEKLDENETSTEDQRKYLESRRTVESVRLMEYLLEQVRQDEEEEQMIHGDRVESLITRRAPHGEANPKFIYVNPDKKFNPAMQACKVFWK